MDAHPRIASYIRMLPGYQPWMDACIERGLDFYRWDDPEGFVSAVVDESSAVYEAMFEPEGDEEMDDRLVDDHLVYKICYEAWESW